MTTTPNMGMVLPDDHGSVDVWGGLLNSIFQSQLDLHDHTTGKGVKIPSAALNINADVTWASGGVNYAITALKAIDFTAVAAASVAALAGALFVNSADSELYYRTIGGANVKLTSGAALNVAAFTGGIGGDYPSVGALLDFDDASDSYRLRQQVGAAVRQFAKVQAADLQLFEYKAAGATPVPSNAVTLKSPAALAAGYTVTFPTAVPAATELVSMTSAGALTTSTAHGNRVLNISTAIGTSVTNTNITFNATNGAIQTTGATTLFIPITLKQGDRIKSITIAGIGDTVVDVTTLEVLVTNTASASTTIGTTSITNMPAVWTDTTIDVTDTVIGAGDVVVLRAVVNATGAVFNNLRVTYDRP